jgi:hypothetical protein
LFDRFKRLTDRRLDEVSSSDGIKFEDEDTGFYSRYETKDVLGRSVADRFI